MTCDYFFVGQESLTYKTECQESLTYGNAGAASGGASSSLVSIR
jgi:hypothetical protein